MKPETMQVLIIEDDPEIAALERDYLLINGYEVVVTGSGMHGLTRLRDPDATPIDLIILDIMLPGMDGFEVLQAIRELPRDIPVLIVSARGEDIDKIRGLGLGADDYIPKPFSPGELVARVSAHLSRYRRLTEKGERRRRSDITIRGLRIDMDDRRVTRRSSGPDEEIPLTAKEFDLLAFLAQNPNRVWAKDDLFENVWGMDAMGDSGTVVVHIKKIREKIELDPQNPQYIETVWGAGYRLRV